MTAEGLSASLEEHPRAAGIRGALRSREKKELDRINQPEAGKQDYQDFCVSKPKIKHRVDPVNPVGYALFRVFQISPVLW